jgi:hypothetical protein
MGETEKRKKKRKKRQPLVLKEQTEENPAIADMIKVMEKLGKKGKQLKSKFVLSAKDLECGELKP